MDRSIFLKRMTGLGCCAAMVSTLINFDSDEAASSSSAMTFCSETEVNDKPDELTSIKKERDFIQNWINDLMDAMDKVLDQETYIKLIEGCGRGCYNRHQFKKDISIAGHGNLDNLLTAYQKNFEVWKEDDKVHIRFGDKSTGCYCPVLKNNTYNSKGLHCNCTKATHQAIFENALGRPVKVDILESLRRGGQTCHFLVHV